MHPAVFIAGFLLVGLLFATQQWVGVHMWYRRFQVSIFLVAAGWELQYVLWGVFCWMLWFWLGSTLQKANWKYILFRLFPLSILMSVVVEVVLVAAIPQFPISSHPMTFWERLDFDLTDEFLGNMTIFWSAFLLFRALGYYEESRQKERALSQLAVELTRAQMQALRMQINPHFLFNTMNSISSLMQTDIAAADDMLEQLSSMLRIALERGSKQMISLGEEIEFIEMYLALQDRRYAGRVQQEVSVDPQLYDALVPAMLLQPLVENAYVHGLSRITANAALQICASREDSRLILTVRNTGIGLTIPIDQRVAGTGVGLSNIKNRLQLHFNQDQSINIREISPDLVQVDLSIPLIFSDSPEKILLRYGAS
ncbi:MAG TPA: histidine kinase [Terracidiphilus sp.]